MARGRMVSTEVAVDLELNSLSLPAYALYLATIPHLDRDGLIDAHPVRLAAVVAPLRMELRDNAPLLINEWVERGLVIRYDVSSRQSVLFFPGFRRHQQGMEYGREPVSRFPPPPGWVRTTEGLVPDDPELCRRLAGLFHAKSAYRRVLLEHSSSDDVGTEASCNVVADISVSFDHGDDGATEFDIGALRQFNLLLIEEFFGPTTWDGAESYVDQLDYDGLLRLMGWLWKCVVRPAWSESIGVGFVRAMMERGAVAGLTPGERTQMIQALAQFRVEARVDLI